MIHDPTHARAFGRRAEHYGRYRPGPPPEAAAWLLPHPCRLAVDLAAGTGAMTGQMIPHSAHVVAVEPDMRMGAVLTRDHPSVHLLAGYAEAIPLTTGCADAVVIASAWHWLNVDDTIPQLARILADNGTLGIAWTYRDSTTPWVAGLDDLITHHGAGDISRDIAAIRDADLHLPAGSPFGPVTEHTISWTKTMTIAEIIAYAGTFSQVITLPPLTRTRLGKAIGHYCRTSVPLTADHTVALPMLCRCLQTRRHPRAANPLRGSHR